MEDVVVQSICDGRPPWTMTTAVYVSSCVLFVVSEAWWRGGARDGV